MSDAKFVQGAMLRRATRAGAVFVGTLCALGSSGPVGAGDAAAQSPVIGIIDQARVSEADVIAANQPKFDRLQDDYDSERRHLELTFAKARHDLLQRDLDLQLDRAALEMEAKARQIGTDEVLASLKAAIPTAEEVRAFYDAHRGHSDESFEEAAPKILEYLSNERNQANERRFYDELRAKHGIASILAPYRVSVAALGPARGPSEAPVTIVEFADFQCPYCKAAESSLHSLMQRYPRDVRIVFRNFPLTQLHPNARLAAEAAICAERQGKFWEMHDAMYQDQSALSLDSLKSTATRLGMSGERFSACLGDDSTHRALGTDEQAAKELGLRGTPYFFVNGRPLDGNVPVETFERVIADELQHEPHDRS